jgi:hypothetical protein
VAKVYGLELDRRFEPILARLPVEMLWGDATTYELPDVTKVVANPPIQLPDLLPELRQRRLKALTNAEVSRLVAAVRASASAPGRR